MEKDDVGREEARWIMDLVMRLAKEFYRDDPSFEILTVDNHADGVYIYRRLLDENRRRAGEALGLLKSGWSVPMVLAAYCSAMAHRIYSQVKTIDIQKQFVITGGSAKNIGIVKRLEKELGFEIYKETKIDTQLAVVVVPAPAASGNETGKTRQASRVTSAGRSVQLLERRVSGREDFVEKPRHAGHQFDLGLAAVERVGLAAARCATV